jgi:hypothetical protein
MRPAALPLNPLRFASAGASRRAGSERAGVAVRLLILLVVAFAAATLVWMAFLPQLSAARLAQQSRFGVAIDTLVANPFTGRVHIQEAAIDNPLIYGPREFLRLREFRADAQVFTMWGRRLVLEEVTIDLPLLAVVTNTDGTTNLDLFRERLGADLAAPPGAPQRPFLIKRLHVRVGEVRFVNLTSRRPRERILALEFEHTYQNVSDWKQLLVPELFRRAAMAGGGWEGLAPEDMGRTISEWLRRGGGWFAEPSRRTTETLKSLFEKLEDSAKP